MRITQDAIEELGSERLEKAERYAKNGWSGFKDICNVEDHQEEVNEGE